MDMQSSLIKVCKESELLPGQSKTIRQANKEIAIFNLDNNEVLYYQCADDNKWPTNDPKSLKFTDNGFLVVFFDDSSSSITILDTRVMRVANPVAGLSRRCSALGCWSQMPIRARGLA